MKDLHKIKFLEKRFTFKYMWTFNMIDNSGLQIFLILAVFTATVL